MAAKGVHSYRHGSPPAPPTTARSGWRWCAIRRRLATCAITSTACQASKQQLKAAATTGPARTCCWCHTGSNTAADSGKTLSWATVRPKQLVNDLSARDSMMRHIEASLLQLSLAGRHTYIHTQTHAGRTSRVSSHQCNARQLQLVPNAHRHCLSVHLC